MLEAPHLPSGLCILCVTATYSAYELKTLVQNSNHVWKKTIDNFLLLPNKFFASVKSAYLIICKDTLDMRIVKKLSKGEPTDVLKNIRRANSASKKSTCEPKDGLDKCQPEIVGQRLFICDYCNRKFPSRARITQHIECVHMKVKHCQCQLCGKTFYNSAKLDEHNVVHTRERKFPCDICGMKLVSKMAAVYHRRRHTGEKPYKCEYCDMSFIKSSSRLNHVRRRHKYVLDNLESASGPSKKKNKVPSNEIKLKKPRSSLLKTCTDCGKIFPKGYMYIRHHTSNSLKEPCPICRTLIVRGKELQGHLLSEHKETWHLCKDCPLLFSREENLERHIRTAHSPGAITCGKCGRSFSKESNLKHHIDKMHKTLICKICERQFHNRGCYRMHRRHCKPVAELKNENKIVGPKIFICDYCNREFPSRARISQHIECVHMKVKHCQCQVCGKRFYNSCKLDEHSVVHTRERKFQCDICGMKLVSKMATVYHRRRHTGEKPYKCEYCDMSFISSSRRLSHVRRIHKGERFQCPLCDVSCVRLTVLKRHVERVHRCATLGDLLSSTPEGSRDKLSLQK